MATRRAVIRAQRDAATLSDDTRRHSDAYTWSDLYDQYGDAKAYVKARRLYDEWVSQGMPS